MYLSFHAITDSFNVYVSSFDGATNKWEQIGTQALHLEAQLGKLTANNYAWVLSSTGEEITRFHFENTSQSWKKVGSFLLPGSKLETADGNSLPERNLVLNDEGTAFVINFQDTLYYYSLVPPSSYGCYIGIY